MAVFRPGEFTITDKATEIAGLKKGDRVIDIGCGEGDTVAHLAEKFGFETEGIDMNLAMISEAKSKHPGINVKFGDGRFADSFFVLFLSPVAMRRCPIPLFYRGGRGGAAIPERLSETTLPASGESFRARGAMIENK